MDPPSQFLSLWSLSTALGVLTFVEEGPPLVVFALRPLLSPSALIFWAKGDPFHPKIWPDVFGLQAYSFGLLLHGKDPYLPFGHRGFCFPFSNLPKNCLVVSFSTNLFGMYPVQTTGFGMSLFVLVLIRVIKQQFAQPAF